ncbi:hypothetical protein PMIN01_07336 [Paraphaeosphaeria minitans]|uniref:Uncharacterized protein n=1 Tax=Paraphaeosphaeria minitans TaxID=565426 RepID=A0A9P6GFQ5_9PLEO|nr:hypothetical protein PMIN01_07336 [Paraphaeosphaeria minitans]
MSDMSRSAYHPGQRHVTPRTDLGTERFQGVFRFTRHGGKKSTCMMKVVSSIASGAFGSQLVAIARSGALATAPGHSIPDGNLHLLGSYAVQRVVGATTSDLLKTCKAIVTRTMAGRGYLSPGGTQLSALAKSTDTVVLRSRNFGPSHDSHQVRLSATAILR